MRASTDRYRWRAATTRSRDLPVVLKVAGVALLSFSCFGVLQFLGFECLVAGPALPPGSTLSFACFLGVDPILLPFLLGVGAGFLLVGALLDRQVLGRGFPWAPPGLGFVVLGGAVLEIASTYIISAWGFGFSPLSPTLLAGGLLLLGWGGWTWWSSSTEDTSLGSLHQTHPERHEEHASPTMAHVRRTWPGILMTLGIACCAFGIFALVLGLVSRDGCVSVPAYWCYDPGFEPSMSLPIVVVGGALLLAGALLLPESYRRDLPPTRWRLGFLVLGAGVLEAGVALVIFGNHNSGWTVSVDAPTLLVAGGLMVARGASDPSPKLNRQRLLIVLGTTGLALDLANIWYFAWTKGLPVYFQSNEGWNNYFGTVILAESAFVGVAYGFLILNAILMRRMDSSRSDGRVDRVRERQAGASLIISGGLILAMMVGWFIIVDGMFFPTPYIVVGVAVHAFPLLAVLLCLGSASRATGPRIPGAAPDDALT